MKKTLLFFFFLLLVMPANLCRAKDTAVPTDGPVPGSKVLAIFVDSLRPDVVDAMVAEGKLPNIKKLFYDQGLRFENFFTIFPSLTVCAYGGVLTGKWQDQSGLKAQSLFERFPTRKKPILKRVFHVSEQFPRYFNLLSKLEKAPEVLKQDKAKALYNYLGEAFHTTVVPVSPNVMPWAWPHIAANDVDRPYFVTTDSLKIIDDLNGKYALRYMVPDGRAELLMVWFNQMDTEQHRNEGGQFDPVAQKKLENVDQWLGKIYAGMVRESKGRHPYVVLFSDHGAYGGQDGIYNQPYYIGRDFFYKVLKMNVRGPDYTITHPGTDLQSYTYIDNMGRGQAQIFLPVVDSLSGNWERPNTLYELTHYGLGPNRKSVNLIQELMDIDLSKRNDFPEKINPHPVDLAFVKLSEDLIYVRGRGVFPTHSSLRKQGSDTGSRLEGRDDLSSMKEKTPREAIYATKQGGTEALIFIEKNNGQMRYRYQSVRNVSQDETGRLTYEETFIGDPFGYFNDPKFHAQDMLEFIQEFHDDQEWLEATYETAYPDAIPALAHALTWSSKLTHLAKSRDPDIWLSATPGWNFRIEDIKGADHGSIARDSMRATLMFSGPNIRTGVDPTPHRMIDVTPTLLQLIGHKEETEFDSTPIQGIYEA